MKTNVSTNVAFRSAEWYSEEFVSKSVVIYLKENGYKVHKEDSNRETDEAGKVITASKFFRREVIEVKGYRSYYHSVRKDPIAKNGHAKNWFTEALFNSFVNFTGSDTAQVAMALPNVSRYQAIIKKLNDYFSINDLYFRIYLVNEDGSVEVSNLNYNYANMQE